MLHVFAVSALPIALLYVEIRIAKFLDMLADEYEKS